MRLNKIQRTLRLYLSDFLHLFTPAHKGIYSWKQILIGIAILALLLYMAYIATSL